MQPEFIAKLITLVQQKRDRIVVTDSGTGKAVVILDFAEYERLLGQNDAPASAAAQSEVTAPPATPPPEPQKKPKFQPRIASAPPAEPLALADLTQEEFLEKLNRDLSAWKTAQERKRGLETAPPPAKIRPQRAASALEEEERFYLEPLE